MGKKEEKGIPKEIFEKDPRIRIIGEGGEKPLPTEEEVVKSKEALPPKERAKKEVAREKSKEEKLEKREGEVENGEEKEQKVVKVDESLEHLVSAPTIETPLEKGKGSEATYYQFEESEEGLKRVEVGEVVTYGAGNLEEPQVEKRSSTRSVIFWAALGLVIFLIFLFFLVIVFLLRL